MYFFLLITLIFALDDLGIYFLLLLILRGAFSKTKNPNVPLISDLINEGIRILVNTVIYVYALGNAFRNYISIKSFAMATIIISLTAIIRKAIMMARKGIK